MKKSVIQYSYQKNGSHSPCFACFGIQLIRIDLVEEGCHFQLDLLGIREHVRALLVVDPRHAVEEISLQAQGDRGAGLDDLLACSLHINLLDGLFRHSLAARFVADGCHEPRVKSAPNV